MAFDAESDLPEEELLARYARGDQSAARTLTVRFAPAVLALARRMLRDPAEAEDIAQEAMLRLWKIAPDWRAGEARVSTWLYRVTANLCTDRLRKAARTDTGEMPEVADDRPGAEANLQQAARARALRQAMDRLPERQRLALTMRHFLELGNPDIAAALETSVEAVESLLARARRSLAADLADQRDAYGLQTD